MPNNPSVGIRFNELDKAALKELAVRLNMSQANVLRGLVRETLTILKEREARDQNKPAEPEAQKA
jgi:hypothetical protein